MGKIIVVLILLLAVTGVGLYFANASESLFFDTAPWDLLIAVGVGIVLGAVRCLRKGKPIIVGRMVVRHGIGSFVAHWGSAIGIFTLIASGIILGFLFIPSFAKTAEAAAFPLNMHFIGLVVTLFAGCFWAADFLVSRNYSSLVPNLNDIIGGTLGKYLLRRKWSSEGKYLSSQKSAFLAFIVLGGGILVTGAIKVAAHIWPIQASVYGNVTFIHDIFSLLFILLLIVHVLLVVALGHWQAFRSYFTGKMSEKYVEEEHPIWHEELKRGGG
jgi:cytochrome b subunit of formate dehydrogenase